MSVLLILCFPKAAPAQRYLVYTSVDIFKNTFFLPMVCPLFSEIIFNEIAEPEVNQKPNKNNNRAAEKLVVTSRLAAGACFTAAI